MRKLNLIVVFNKELDKLKDEDFVEIVKKYVVYARVSPEHKVKIVKAWKENEKTVSNCNPQSIALTHAFNAQEAL